MRAINIPGEGLDPNYEDERRREDAREKKRQDREDNYEYFNETPE